MGQINTKSGGLVETGHSPSKLAGDQCWLHIDQSTNINSSEGDAAIMLNNQEVKDLIAILNDYVNYVEGQPYVVLAAPLLHPDVHIMIGKQEIEKIPQNVNPYLGMENVITPADTSQNIDYDHYFEYIKPTLPQQKPQ